MHDATKETKVATTILKLSFEQGVKVKFSLLLETNSDILTESDLDLGYTLTLEQ